jgi:hypothetical protein
MIHTRSPTVAPALRCLANSDTVAPTFMSEAATILGAYEKTDRIMTIVVAGPVGTGKSSLLNALLNDHKSGFRIMSQQERIERNTPSATIGIDMYGRPCRPSDLAIYHGLQQSVGQSGADAADYHLIMFDKEPDLNGSASRAAATLVPLSTELDVILYNVKGLPGVDELAAGLDFLVRCRSAAVELGMGARGAGKWAHLVIVVRDYDGPITSESCRYHKARLDVEAAYGDLFRSIELFLLPRPSSSDDGLADSGQPFREALASLANHLVGISLDIGDGSAWQRTAMTLMKAIETNCTILQKRTQSIDHDRHATTRTSDDLIRRDCVSLAKRHLWENGAEALLSAPSFHTQQDCDRILACVRSKAVMAYHRHATSCGLPLHVARPSPTCLRSSAPWQREGMASPPLDAFADETELRDHYLQLRKTIYDRHQQLGTYTTKQRADAGRVGSRVWAEPPRQPRTDSKFFPSRSGFVMSCRREEESCSGGELGERLTADGLCVWATTIPTNEMLGQASWAACTWVVTYTPVFELMDFSSAQSKIGD